VHHANLVLHQPLRWSWFSFRFLLDATLPTSSERRAARTFTFALVLICSAGLPEAAAFRCGLVTTSGICNVRTSFHIRLGFHCSPPALRQPAFKFVLVFIGYMPIQSLNNSGSYRPSNSSWFSLSCSLSCYESLNFVQPLGSTSGFFRQFFPTPSLQIRLGLHWLSPLGSLQSSSYANR
jgi:hypothetical protein